MAKRTAHTIAKLRGFLERAEARVDEIEARLSDAEGVAQRFRAQIHNRLLADPRYAIPPDAPRIFAEGYRGYLYQRADEGGETFDQWQRSTLGQPKSDDEPWVDE